MGRPPDRWQDYRDRRLGSQHSNPEMSRHFQGIIETVWSGTDSFLEAYYNPTTYKQEVSDAVTVKKLIEKYKALENR